MLCPVSSWRHVYGGSYAQYESYYANAWHMEKYCMIRSKGHTHNGKQKATSLFHYVMASGEFHFVTAPWNFRDRLF